MHAVRLAATAAGVDGEAFLLGDQETVTWKDFFRPVLDALGMTIEQIPDVEPPLVPRIWSDPIAYCRSTERGAAILAGLPPRSREVLRAMRGAWRQLARSRRSPWLASGPRHPNISLEKALLQQCQVKLPLAKARTILGYEPIVSFAGGAGDLWHGLSSQGILWSAARRTSPHTDVRPDCWICAVRLLDVCSTT